MAAISKIFLSKDDLELKNDAFEALIADLELSIDQLQQEIAAHLAADPPETTEADDKAASALAFGYKLLATQRLWQTNQMLLDQGTQWEDENPLVDPSTQAVTGPGKLKTFAILSGGIDPQ